jgi:chemotaxis protein histidine kinase CheA/ActR/RegA family two-component response regulator
MSLQPEVLNATLEEFKIMRREFDQLANNHVTSPNTDCIDRYFTALNLLSETAALLNLSGMQGCLDKQAENLIMIDPGIDIESQLPGFSLWLDIAEQHLTNPTAETPCIAWVNLLENTYWPSPLDEQESRTLINAFADEMSFDNQQTNSESEAIDFSELSTKISLDSDQSVIEAFLLDTPVQLEKLFNKVSRISFKAISTNTLTTLQAAQRISHTIKGSANLVGLTALAWLAHKLEDFFESLTNFCQADNEHQWCFNPEETDVIFETLDCMMTLLDDAKHKQDSTVDYQTILQRLVAWPNWQKTVEEIAPALHNEVAPDNTEKDPAEPATIQAALTEIDQQAWVKLVEEMSINLVQSQELFKQMTLNLNDLKNQDLKIQEQRFELENAVDSRSMAQVSNNGFHQDFDSLEMDRYDDIHRTSHQFIESVSDNRELIQSLHNKIRHFDSLIRQQRRYTEQFQHQVMQSSQQPLSAISSRLQRCVRQAARFTDKEVTLFLAGDDLRADRKVVQALADPLMHLLRNCVDHGIETERGDKPVQGRIDVSYKIIQRNIEIKVSDDGAGIDVKTLLQSAKDRQIPLTDQQRTNPLQLIFLSGLTTRKETTQISGRGVGMDAAADQIRQLGGQIRVSSTPEVGTEFLIRIPLSQVTRHIIICRIGQEQFAIDSSHLQQIIPPGGAYCERKGEQWVVNWQDDWIQVRSIHEKLNEPALQFQPGLLTVPLVVMEHEQKRLAVGIDSLLNSFDLVLKPFGNIVHSLPGFTGMTQTGDGTLVPVLNLTELLLMGTVEAEIQKNQTLQQELPQILVVDDSLSIRNSLKLLLTDVGLKVDTATDGIDALEKITIQRPAVILLDMEMPRMSGLELTRTLRNRPGTENLPILMITSRSHGKHREQAKAVGVNEYLTKPFNENEVIDTVRHWMNAQSSGEEVLL